MLMMDRVVNLPTKASGEKVFGTVRDDGYRIQLKDGLEVCFIYGDDAEGVAESIARVIELARDRGFEQGLASVRAALGVKE